MGSTFSQAESKVTPKTTVGSFPILLDYKGIKKGKSSSKFKGNIMIGASREKN